MVKGLTVRAATAAVVFAVLRAGAAAVALPPPAEWAAAPGAPAAPGDAFPAVFADPPVAVDPAAPVVGEWTRTVLPGESFALSGVRFTARTGDETGSDTTVWLWADDGAEGVLLEAEVRSVTGHALLARAPDNLPVGMAFLWVENLHGPGAPVCLNRPEAQWIGPMGSTAPAGAGRRVFGKNLAHAHGTDTSHVYVQPASGGAFTPCSVTNVEPYAVSFVVPPSLATGAYRVYVHAGHGGAWGWSDPLDLTVAPDGQRGAGESVVPPSGGDDTAALQAAVNTVSGWSNGGTVRMQAGLYTITGALEVKSNVRLAGAGMTNTTVEIRLAADRTGGPMQVVGNHAALEDFTLKACGTNTAHFGLTGTSGGMAVDDLRVRRVRFTAEPGTWGDGIKSAGFSFNVGEVADCVFDRTFSMNWSTDVWVHGNTFHGGLNGPYGWSWSEAGVSMNTFTRLVLERNHFETPAWPEDPATGSRNYKTHGFLSSDDAAYLQICKRIMNCSANMMSPTHAYVAWNTSEDVAVEDNKGEMILFHEAQSHYYAQVAANSGRTLTIRTDGTVHGEALLVGVGEGDEVAPMTAVPGTVNASQDTIDGKACVLIVSGDGMGQYRRIESHTATTVTVEEPWRVPPGTNSVVVLLNLYRDTIVYRNELNAFPEGYEYVSHAASVGIGHDGNVVGCEAEGNVSRRTFTGRAVHGRPTAPCMWNTFRDETAEDCHTAGYSFQVWSGATPGEAWTDSPGATHLGNFVRGGAVDCAMDGFALGLNPNALDSHHRYTQASAVEGVSVTAGGDGIEAGNLADVLFRNVSFTLPASATGVEFYPNHGTALEGNTYTGAGSAYGSDVTCRITTWQGSGRWILKSPGAGDYARYDALDFGAGASLLEMNFSSVSSLDFEVRLDSPAGPLVASGTVTTTGTASFPVSGASGMRDVYFVFPSASNCQLEWLRFTGATTVYRLGGSFDATGNTTEDALLARTVPVPPRRVARLAGDAFAPPAARDVPVHNTGATGLVWTAVSDQAWLTPSNTGASPVPAEQTNGMLRLAADLSGLAVGEHLAVVKLTGGSVTSAVGVVLQVSEAPLEVALEAPLEGTIRAAGGDVALGASVTAGAATSVVFTAGGVPVDTDASAPWTGQWSGAPASGPDGSLLRAVAYSDYGRVSTSGPVRVWITPAGGSASLPFTEPFEAPAVTAGPLDGQNGWLAGAGAEATPTAPYGGAQALGFASSATARHAIDGAGHPQVWIDVRRRALGTEGRPAVEAAAAALFAFAADRRLEVYDGLVGGWVTLSNAPPAAGAWVRLSARVDYDRDRWSLYLDGTNVASELGFAGSPAQLTGVRLDGDGGAADDLAVGVDVPAGVTALPADDPGGDADADGMSNSDETLAGTDPLDPGSVLRLARIVLPAGGGIEMHWPSMAGRVYDVMEAVSPGGWPGTALYSGLAADPPTNTQSLATGSTAGFYRVRVRVP